MSKNLKIFSLVFTAIALFFTFEVLFLSLKSKNISQKQIFVKYIGLPDLSISTEAKYIRHRSLSSTYSIYNIDANLREFSPLTFVYAHSNISNHQHSKIVYADAKK
jgi:hypothetical protein